MQSEFKTVLSDTRYSDKLYLFLQNVFHLYPEDKLYQLIKQVSAQCENDQQIYQTVQSSLKSIKPMLADFTYALPALAKQKAVITEQTLTLLGDKKALNGYVEIGTTGRYISRLRKHIQVQGPIYLINDKAPTHSPADMIDRGGIAQIGQFVPLNDYQPLSSAIADNSVDLVTCYIGLHHIPFDLLPGFIASIHRVLRVGGAFILRDHDCLTEDMKRFVSHIHTVFNIGTKVSWQDNQKEFRYFRSVQEWVDMLEKQGFKAAPQRLLQDHDPSDNTLLLFSKTGA